MTPRTRTVLWVSAGVAGVALLALAWQANAAPSDARIDPATPPGTVPPSGTPGQRVTTLAPFTLRRAPIATAIGFPYPAGTVVTIVAPTNTTRGGSRLHEVTLEHGLLVMRGWCFLNSAELAGG